MIRYDQRLLDLEKKKKKCLHATTCLVDVRIAYTAELPELTGGSVPRPFHTARSSRLY